MVGTTSISTLFSSPATSSTSCSSRCGGSGGGEQSKIIRRLIGRHGGSGLIANLNLNGTRLLWCSVGIGSIAVVVVVAIVTTSTAATATAARAQRQGPRRHGDNNTLSVNPNNLISFSTTMTLSLPFCCRLPSLVSLSTLCALLLRMWRPMSHQS